jgi:hypothetical protein
MKHSSVLGVIALFALACTGPMGPRGETGSAGMTGAQGPAGMTGMTGTAGQPGTTASPRTSAAGWISLRDILFDHDTADIRASETNKFSEIAAYVKQNPDLRVGISGSSDLVRGTERHDADLSQRRVANVRDELIRSGVSASRIDTGSGVERVECGDPREQCLRRDGLVEVMSRSN